MRKRYEYCFWGIIELLTTKTYTKMITNINLVTDVISFSLQPKKKGFQSSCILDPVPIQFDIYVI